MHNLILKELVFGQIRTNLSAHRVKMKTKLKLKGSEKQIKMGAQKGIVIMLLCIVHDRYWWMRVKVKSKLNCPSPTVQAAGSTNR